MELKEFRMLLLDRYKELAKSTFSVELLVEKLDSLEQEQEPLMPTTNNALENTFIRTGLEK